MVLRHHDHDFFGVLVDHPDERGDMADGAENPADCALHMPISLLPLQGNKTRRLALDTKSGDSSATNILHPDSSVAVSINRGSAARATRGTSENGISMML